MKSKQYEGYEVLTGSNGEVYHNGERLWEAKKISVTIKPKYEKVLKDGGIEDEKEVGRSGEGELEIDKISDSIHDEWLEDVLKGKRKPFMLRFSMKDQQKDGNTEITINRCKLSGDYELFEAERQKLVGTKIKFIFDPSPQNVQKKSGFSV